MILKILDVCRLRVMMTRMTLVANGVPCVLPAVLPKSTHIIKRALLWKKKDERWKQKHESDKDTVDPSDEVRLSLPWANHLVQTDM